MITVKSKKRMRKVPRLRFPGFKGEWEEKRLGEVAEFFDEKRIPLKQADRKKRTGKYPYYGASGVIDHINDYIFDGEYVLLGEDGANIVDRSSKLAFLVNGKFWVNNHAHVLQSYGSNYFLSEYLESLNFEKFNTGTAQPKLNASVCKAIKLLIPTLPEQQKIADFLTSIDKWINNLKAQKEKLEAYKKGMMQKIFSQKIRFKDDYGDDFPEWEEKRLGEIAEFWNGKAHEQDISENGKYIVVNSKFISTNGRVKKHSNKQISPLKKDDIAIVMSDIPKGRAIGKCYLVDSDGRYTLNQRIGGIKSESVLSNFLFRILSRNKYFLKFDNGVSQTNLRNSEILKCPVTFPCLSEQQKIADFLTSIDNLIEAEQNKIAKAEKWKRGVMQGVFV